MGIFQFTSRAIGLLCLSTLCSCFATKRVELPNSRQASVGTTSTARTGDSELLKSQQAALDAAAASDRAMLEAGKVKKELAALKAEVQQLSALADQCSELAKKSEQRRKASAVKAKKELEAKAAAETLQAPIEKTSAPAGVPEYSKSDAPPGFYKGAQTPQAEKH